MMNNIFSTCGTKNGVMTLILTIQKLPETKCGAILSLFAPMTKNLKEGTLISCHSHVREKITLKIEMEFQNELKSLSNEGKMFYHGGLKRIIKVKMGKLLLCVDRPERTSILQSVIIMEPILHFGDIVVRLMDTVKKTTYPHAKNAGSTVYIR